MKLFTKKAPGEPKLIRSRRKTISLEIKRDGTVIVRAPLFMADWSIRNFIKTKQHWIDRVSERIRKEIAAKPKRVFEEGGQFLYLGEEYPLKVSKDPFLKLHLHQHFKISEKEFPKARKVLEKWYREEAFSIFTERIKIYAAQMEVRYASIGLSSAKGRWGSCHTSGRLRLNWRLVMSPLEIIDYVVVHELAHLKEMNHSKNFWQIVEKYCPNYRTHRQWLRTQSLTLEF